MRTPAPDMVATGYAAGFYAGFGKRLKAYILDLIILGIVFACLEALVWKLFGFSERIENSANAITYLAVGYLYHVHLI